MRPNNRQPDELRLLRFKRRYTRQAPGSVLVRMGRTTVLCTCCVEPSVPPFLKGTGKGWLSAEYGMLPGSTNTRKPRDRAGKVDGRSVEIQRLIGRSLRAVVNLDKLGERTLWLDCDVIEADGGTRTASINGAFVAMCLAIGKIQKTGALKQNPVRSFVAAVSVGIVGGVPMIDLNYPEDSSADVDFNLVMTDKEEFVEIQGTAERNPFSPATLAQLLELGRIGIQELITIQRDTISRATGSQ